MSRAAIFVDAGYLFAQGSTALAGSKQPRDSLSLNNAAVVARLDDVRAAKCATCSLLRVYWYDGAVAGRSEPTIEQAALAFMDNVKVRLGFVNSLGQQKGVDSLIVTDMIELARLGAISDAILLSGDEDVRVGVQVAQTFGVRVHLLGITPSRGSQSKNLIQEADTTTEWDRAMVASFLSIRPAAASESAKAAVPLATESASRNAPVYAKELVTVVQALCTTLSASDVESLIAFWKEESGIPKEFDSKLLIQARARLARDLDRDEKRFIRKEFRAVMLSRAAPGN